MEGDGTEVSTPQCPDDLDPCPQWNHAGPWGQPPLDAR
jgi:hypothetical protein